MTTLENRPNTALLVVDVQKGPQTHENPAFSRAFLTGATGLEPATSGVTGRRSNQLSYAPERIGTASVAVVRRPPQSRAAPSRTRFS